MNNYMYFGLKIIILLLVCHFHVLAESNFEREICTVYESGSGGYHTYRIPALGVTTKGTILAFCEGRENKGDAGNIDILLKRSTDNGKTWSDQIIVWSDGENTCGNPCVVVDEDTGIIWLLMTRNLGSDHERQIIDGSSKETRTVWVSHSSDDGISWTKPIDITSSTKQENWSWYATGPGCGIQLCSGRFNGRLVIPCDHIEKGSKKYYSHVSYSDDHGNSWKLGGSTRADKLNECQVVELSDGRIMLNSRNYFRENRTRAVSCSDDGGVTWSETFYDSELVEPICQASIVKWMSDDDNSQSRPYLLFSNPASMSSRVNMTVRLSYDDGKTWPVAKLLYSGASAYSCLAVTADGTAGCLFEKGNDHPYEMIVFDRFSFEWLKQ